MMFWEGGMSMGERGGKGLTHLSVVCTRMSCPSNGPRLRVMHFICLQTFFSHDESFFMTLHWPQTLRCKSSVCAR